MSAGTTAGFCVRGVVVVEGGKKKGYSSSCRVCEVEGAAATRAGGDRGCSADVFVLTQGFRRKNLCTVSGWMRRKGEGVAWIGMPA